MQYPFFDFPFYHPEPDIDFKRIYPIGSIIFRSSPLANKTEWTDVNLFDSHFYVDWEDMTWELIVSIRPSDLEDPTTAWGDFHSEVHSVRNVRLQYTRTQAQLARGVCTATMVIDDQNQGTFNLNTFTGANTHKHALGNTGHARLALIGNGQIHIDEVGTDNWNSDYTMSTGGSGVYTSNTTRYGVALGGETYSGSLDNII